jgi:phosphate starvation-inducible PhoH-like protein
MEIKFICYNKKECDNICGKYNCNLEIIEKSLDVEIEIKENEYYVAINGDNAQQAKDILQYLEYLSEYKFIEISDVEIVTKYNAQQIKYILQYLRVLSSCKSINIIDVEMAVKIITKYNDQQIEDISYYLRDLSSCKSIETVDIEMAVKIIAKCNSQQIEDISQYLAILSNYKSIETSAIETVVKDYTQTYVPNKADNINTLKVIDMHSRNQRDYVHAIKTQDLIFGIGKESTGKTYLAIACAIEALNNSKITRIVIANDDIKTNGEINSHLLNIYDILYELIGFETTKKLLKANIIEIVPLNCLTNRTLNNAFIILDGIKYSGTQKYLTCMGFGSKMVINENVKNGSGYKLSEITKKLKDESSISFCYFHSGDIVRAKTAQRAVKILRA